jgi:Sporulation and spore germination
MIPRYQRFIFWGLIGGIVGTALVLIHGCEQAREKLTRHRNETPLAAPIASPSETVRLAMANDATGSITMVEREIALPTETTARARVLLGRLIAEYSYKDSTHPLESGPAVDDVFLLDLPLKPAVATGVAGAKPAKGEKTGAASNTATAPDETAETEDKSTELPRAPGGQLAVVNLHGSFADGHPSGIEAETLTIESIVGTLYANFPRIEQVRFLVDGQPRETLNGHADLMRTYPVADTATRAAQAAAQPGAQGGQ